MASPDKDSAGPQTATEEAKDDETRWTLDQLREEAYPRFRHSYPEVAGALADSSRKTHTRAQIEQALKDYLKRPQEHVD